MPAKRAPARDSPAPRDPKKQRTAIGEVDNSIEAEGSTSPGDTLSPPEGAAGAPSTITPSTLLSAPGAGQAVQSDTTGEQDDDAAPPTSLAVKKNITRTAKALNQVPPLLPNEDTTLLPPKFRSYIPDNVYSRLNQLILYANVNVHVYAIGRLPRMLQWGPASGGADDLSTYLTIGGVPVKMWVTAEVKVPWFFKTNGSIQKRAAICFVPLRDCDAERGLLMSTAYCKPQADSPDKKGMWASKWLASKDTPEQEIMPFDEVYDARKTLRPKRDMKKLEVNVLKPNDIVLVEALVRRYAPRTDGYPKPSASAGWTSWKTFFELNSISLIVKAPEKVAADAEEAFDVEI